MSASGKGPDGRQARWDKHNQARRQVILDAALAVVEAGEPGAEFHVQQIAERAGMSRTVVYRHFADRSDLERALQTEVLEGLTAHLLPGLTLDGTAHEIIGRIVSSYVEWAVDHPALHRLAEQAQAGTAGPLEDGINRIASVLVDLLQTAIPLLGVELDEEEAAAIDPLAYGLVGAVFGAVRRWVGRTPRRPSAAALSALLTHSVWHLIDGHARELGLVIDPDVPVEQLLGPAAPDPAEQAAPAAEAVGG